MKFTQAFCITILFCVTIGCIRKGYHACGLRVVKTQCGFLSCRGLLENGEAVSRSEMIEGEIIQTSCPDGAHQ